MPTKAAEYMDEKTLDGLNKDEPSNRELADGLKLIIRKLWSREELDEIIENKHRELCEHCPLRNQVVPVPDANKEDEEPEKHDKKNFEDWLKDTIKAHDKSSEAMHPFYDDIIFFATNRIKAAEER